MVLNAKEVLYLENKGAMIIKASKLPEKMLKKAFRTGHNTRHQVSLFNYEIEEFVKALKLQNET